MTVSPLFLDFRKPTNAKELARFLGTSEEMLNGLVDNRKKPLFFLSHEIPKQNTRNGDAFRTVWEASDKVTDIYKAFGRRFDIFARTVETRYPTAASFGYVRGRSTLENAEKHCLSKILLRTDIHDFFPSIEDEMIVKMMINLGINQDVSQLLTSFLTIDYTLPLGLSPSPLIANLVCLDLDEKLTSLANQHSCTYTRYADDIAISGSTSVPTKEEVKAIIAEAGFLMSDRKFRITKPGQAHFVTGLSVSDVRPHVPKWMKRRLRQELYYCEKHGIADHVAHKGHRRLKNEVNRLDGMVRYVSHIEKESLPTLRDEWVKLLHQNKLYPSYDSLEDAEVRNLKIYVDESVIQFNGKEFLLLALAQTGSWDEVEASTAALLQKYLVDPFAGGKKEVIEQKKIHFTDVNEDLKAAYIDRLASFDARGYVIYAQLKQPSDYTNLYLQLLGKILPHRLMAVDNGILHLVFEENSHITNAQLQNAVESISKSLADNRHPSKLTAEFGAKADHLCFSMPDFLLGVFGKYARFKEKEYATERNKLFFERLRDKYRKIIDADTNIIYSRKRQFTPWP